MQRRLTSIALPLFALRKLALVGIYISQLSVCHAALFVYIAEGLTPSCAMFSSLNSHVKLDLESRHEIVCWCVVQLKLKKKSF